METSLEELINSYKELSDEELLNLHASGGLTEVAYNVLETELSRRDIPVPARTAEEDIPLDGGFPSFRSYWDGKASLAKAYWLLGWLGNIVLATVYKIIAAQESLILDVSFLLFYAAYFTFTCISVWCCAWNTSWKGWGYLARFMVVLGAIGFATELLRTFF